MADGARLLLLAGLLLAPALATAADDEQTWYQVEIILFANESVTAQTRELLTDDRGATQAAAAVALAPPWPAPVRPERTTELEMLWHSAGAAPSLARIAPSLDPETMRVLRWLARLDAGTEPPPMDWLEGIESLTWDPDAPPPRPVPEIRPEVAYAATPLPTRTEEVRDDVREPEAEAPEIEIPMALAFRSVEADQLVLAAEAARLRRARDFRVLEHLAWRQPFVAGAPAVPVAVSWREPAGDAPRLAGNVGVYLRRYLHVEFDLAWLEERALDAYGEETLRWVPIEQSRRMRSGQTHYVDHPRVGALVHITPFALAAPLTEDGPPVPAASD
ncbi:MAG: CsiV family protein [Pseudomonadales bacterium]|jgi:hypothetical protein|nr:CsiV family protein [Pseudomonadales bacterium]